MPFSYPRSLRHRVSVAGNDNNHYPLFMCALVVAFAFILRLSATLLMPSIYRPDEIFQNLEPAYRIWSGHGIMTWDWRMGIRSPMFPGFLAGLMWLSNLAGLGARGYLAVIAGTLSAVATGTVAVAWLVGWRQARWLGALVCGLLCATWPDLVHLGPKTLGEVQAGNILIIATYLAAYEPDPVSPGGFRGFGRMMLAGLLLGLVFCFRFQLAPALIVVAVWTCRTDARGRWLPLVVGGLLSLAALGLTDALAWGFPFASVIRNYHFNVTEHGSSDFGVQPVWYYPAKMLLGWGAAMVPVALAFIAGIRRAPLLGCVALTILLTHTAVPHKEFTFVFAALPPLLIVAGLGSVDLVLLVASRRGVAVGARAVFAASALWVAISGATATGGGFLQQWQAHGNVLRAEAALRSEPRLCGVGLRWPVWWIFSGGDAFIGQPVPFYGFGTVSSGARVAPAVNFIIGGRNVANGLPGFSVMRCWSGIGDDVCLARAPAEKACVPDPALELNAMPDLGLPGTGVPDHPDD